MTNTPALDMALKAAYKQGKIDAFREAADLIDSEGYHYCGDAQLIRARADAEEDK